MAREPEPITDLRRALGDRLKIFRCAAELTQAQLAAKVFCDRSTVAHVEKGRTRLDERFWQAADDATNAGGALLSAFRHLEAVRRAHELHSRQTELAEAKAKADSIRGVTAQPEAPIHRGDEGDQDVRRDQEQWLRVRQAPGVRGRELSELAAWLYPPAQRAPGGHVLAGPGWLLEQPVELDAVRLVFTEAQAVPRQTPMDHVLPLAVRDRRYSSYARAVRDLVMPRLLENRLSYRLVDVSQDKQLVLTFGTTTFFEVFDIKQPVAHEFKAAWMASGRSVPAWDALPLRSQIGDPFDPGRLVLSPGISTLTIRKDVRGEHRFVLHERDGGKVADGGGLCHVMPAGEFQPSSVLPADVRNDFSLWRNIMREYSEEFLGNPEHDGGSSGPLDYGTDEPFRSFDQARAEGRFRLWHYGLVMEPLELGAAQLTVAVIDGDAFDSLFATLVEANDEGHIVGAGGRRDMPFTADAIDRLEPRLSGSALTLLRLAWRDRRRLVG